jgi:hypothetical protein
VWFVEAEGFDEENSVLLANVTGTMVDDKGSDNVLLIAERENSASLDILCLRNDGPRQRTMKQRNGSRTTGYSLGP